MPDPTTINSPNGEPQRPGGIGVQDILCALFHHKWLIVICTSLGIVGAVVAYFVVPPIYVSEAQLLIRYVVENKPINPSAAADTTIKSPDSRGENIMNSQVAILSSLDLATIVADQGLAEKVLASYGGGMDTNLAGLIIRKGLQVEVPKRTDVIRVVFRHPDPSVVQPVINSLIKTYIERHEEIYQGVGVMNNTYQLRKGDFRTEMLGAESRLNQMRTNYGIISIDDAKRTYSEQIARLTTEITAAEAQLAEMEVLAGTPAPAPAATTNTVGTADGTAPASTNLAIVSTNAPATPTNQVAATQIPKDKLTLYANVLKQIDDLAKMESQLLGVYTAAHPRLAQLSNEVAYAASRKMEIETEFPTIVTAVLPSPTLSAESPGVPAGSALEPLRVPALQARLASLRSALAIVQAKAAQIVNIEPEVIRLQRERDVAEAGFRYYSAAADQLNQAGGTEGVRNIAIFQRATPPGRDTQKLMKLCGAVFGGGFGLGIGLALLLDLILNRSIRRSPDIEKFLHVPLFLNIPDHAKTTRRGLLPWRRAAKSKKTEPSDSTPDVPDGSEEAVVPAPFAPSPWEHGHGLHPYCEALRDRLITHFDLNKLTHKPKLVALTSCRQGAGVSTLAMGVAASFSETGDGNVLLVDMNGEQGAAHPFSHGKPCSGLSEVLKTERPRTSQVQDNLYLASVHEPNLNHDELPRALPRRFAKIVPKLKASDYDYIIFDMPPVAQTTITARLARYMDIVLMVVESGQTSPDRAAQAKSVLAESGATAVAAVLNKSKVYLPAALSHEL